MQTRVQYALVHVETGDYATVIHQDDEETPLIADSLAALVSVVGEWCDCGSDYVLENLRDGVFVDKTMSDDQYRIVKEVVTVSPLTEADLAEIGRLRQRDQTEREEFRREWFPPAGS